MSLTIWETAGRGPFELASALPVGESSKHITLANVAILAARSEQRSIDVRSKRGIDGRSPARRRISQRPRLQPLPPALVSAIRPGSFSRNYQSWRPCRAGRRLPIQRFAPQLAAEFAQGRRRPAEARARAAPASPILGDWQVDDLERAETGKRAIHEKHLDRHIGLDVIGPRP